MKGLDLSKFKKLSSNDSHTIMRDPKGNELKIAHSQLSPKIKAELDKLPVYKAEGGYANSSNQGAALKEGSSKKKIRRYADGGDTSQPQDFVPGKDYSKEPLPGTPNQTPVVINVGQTPQNNNSGQGVVGADQNGTPTVDLANAFQKVGQAIKSGLTPIPGSLGRGEMVGNNLSNVPDANPPAPVVPLDNSSPAQAPAPMAAMPPADTAPSAPVQQAPATDTQAQTLPRPSGNPDADKSMYTDILNSKDAAYYKDLVNGDIKPETYHTLFQKSDTLGKVGAIFGMLLSGMGSGLTHQPNAFFQILDKQISNDFEAQKANKTNALSMLQKYQEHQNDLSTRALQGKQGQLILQQTAKEREEAQGLHYKNKMYLTALQQMNNLANNLPAGSQKQQAQSVLGAIGQQVQGKVTQNNAQAAGSLVDAEEQWKRRNEAMSMVPETAGIAKYEAERHIPGEQRSASTPIEAKDRDSFAQKQNLLQKTQELRAWAQQHSGSLDPATRAEGDTKARLLQDAYRQANGEGVFRKGESDFISGIVDSEPTKFLNSFRVDPKFKALEGSINTDLQTLRNKYGLGEGSSSTRAQSSSNSGAEIRYDAQGNAWKKGPNGKPVRVK